MNYIKLLFKEYSENTPKIVMLFLISIFISVAGMFWFAQRSYINGSLNIFEDYNLENKVLVYSEVYQNELSEDDIEYISSGEILSVGSVERCLYSTQYNAIYRDNYMNWTHLYIIPELKENPYRMIKGRLPINQNEIMISSNVTNLKCGETLSFYYDKVDPNIKWEDYTKDIDPKALSDMNSPEFIEAYDKYTSDLLEQKTVNLTVVGIFDINSPYPLREGTTFTDMDNSFYGNDISDANSGYAFFNSIVDTEGNDIQCRFNGDLLIAPEEGYTTKDVISELDEKMGNVEAYDFEKFKNTVEQNRAEDIELYKSVSISLIVVLITMNLSYCLINLAINKSKLAIYYISGLPWRNVVLINSFMYLGFVVWGYILGLYIYTNIYKLVDNYSYGTYMFVPKDALTVGLIIIISYALVNLFFYLLTFRKNPIDLIRRG